MACAPHGTCCATASGTTDPAGLQQKTHAAKRRGKLTGEFDTSVTGQSNYTLPQGIVGLTGPVDKPAPGTLPLRGDLAHVALAGRFLAAHYVIPILRTVGDDAVVLKTAMRADASDGATLEAGQQVELLDCAGDWAWVACGPEGPSGYLNLSALQPA